jgi:Uma2 family endonuclease
MALRTAQNTWTVERLHALPDDGNRYEIIDGELLVTPTPTARHQYTVLSLILELQPYCERVGLQILMAPADLIASDNTLVQPDAFVVLLDENGKPPESYETMGRPRLVVESLSPSTEHIDRTRKRKLYLDMQIEEYWILDTGSRVIERSRLDANHVEIIRDSLLWQPVTHIQALTLDVTRLFRRVYGD